MVNLSNLRYLSISSDSIIIKSSSILLQLLKETSQLSSIAIEFHCLQLFFKDDELWKYSNKKITKLDILKHPYEFFDRLDELEKFCQIFSNLEQLICYINHENDLLFLFNHLPKLSFMMILFSTSINRDSLTRSLEDEAGKLKLSVYIEFEHKIIPAANIWIDRNMH
jgi:hypothetical protein